MKISKLPLLHFLYSLIILSLLGCQAPSTLTNDPGVTATPIIKTPNPGMAIMTGKILSITDNKPLVGIPVRLAQIFRQGDEGAFVLDVSHSPSSITDINGVFEILDIAPNEYLMVIGRPEDNNYLIYQDNNNEPITYQISPDVAVNAGEIVVDFIP